MFNVLLFIAGIVGLALVLGWRPTLDTIKAVATGVWSGLKGLAAGPWFPNPGVPHILRLVAAAVSVLLIILAFSFAGGAGSSGSGLSPREELDHAIRDFQSSVNLSPDGVFGPATVKAYYGHR